MVHSLPVDLAVERVLHPLVQRSGKQITQVRELGDTQIPQQGICTVERGARAVRRDIPLESPEPAPWSPADSPSGDWRAAAFAEPWIVSEDEVDEPVLTDFRPHLTASRASS